MSQELATKEGIFVGITSGATFAGRAARSRAEAPKGATILCMLPDTGERYLSTPLFADVPADMTRGGAGDLALDAARSVPGGLECGTRHPGRDACIATEIVASLLHEVPDSLAPAGGPGLGFRVMLEACLGMTGALDAEKGAPECALARRIS